MNYEMNPDCNLREKLGLSQDRFAALFGLSQNGT
jgi:DNA-binding transcriptional regulator YiaG